MFRATRRNSDQKFPPARCQCRWMLSQHAMSWSEPDRCTVGCPLLGQHKPRIRRSSSSWSNPLATRTMTSSLRRRCIRPSPRTPPLSVLVLVSLRECPASSSRDYSVNSDQILYYHCSHRCRKPSQQHDTFVRDNQSSIVNIKYRQCNEDDCDTMYE